MQSTNVASYANKTNLFGIKNLSIYLFKLKIYRYPGVIDLLLSHQLPFSA
jgi:hypothetical protein